jgi:secondary thiamine-phosphate synthase enzyme
MAVFQKTFHLSTRGMCDVVDISSQVEQAVAESGLRTGIVNVSGLGSTLGITTIEFEPGAVQDLREALDRIAPVHGRYAHNARWGDHNGFSHLRSALMGASRTFPVQNGRLRTGTWQQIVLCDFDDRPRRREVTVTVIGE